MYKMTVVAFWTKVLLKSDFQLYFEKNLVLKPQN